MKKSGCVYSVETVLDWIADLFGIFCAAKFVVAVAVLVVFEKKDSADAGCTVEVGVDTNSGNSYGFCVLFLKLKP